MTLSTHTDESHLLYPSGFLFARDGTAVPPEGWAVLETLRWKERPFRGGRLFTRDDTRIHEASSGSSAILLIGHAMDPYCGLPQEQPIVERLAGALDSGIDPFLDAAETLTGRFTLIAAPPGTIHVLTDPYAMRATFVAAGGSRVIASHASLLARFLGRKLSPEAREELSSLATKRTVLNFPGDATAYEDVLLLPPNQLLDLDRGTYRRVFPRAPRSPGGMEEVITSVIPVLTASARMATERWRCQLSLTAGVDSRMTLAAFLDQPRDFDCFTFVAPHSPDFFSQVGDLYWARKICRSVGRPHHTLVVGTNPTGSDFESFKNIWLQNVSGMDADQADRVLVPYTLQRFFPPGQMHVKSTGSEIFRRHFRKAGWELPHITPGALSSIYGNSSPFAESRFARWIREFSFESEALYDYDPLDLLYWEHRIGSWQGAACINLEMSHDTFSIFCNRKLLRQMLDIRPEESGSYHAGSRLIERLAPSLTRFPFTPHRPWARRYARLWRRPFLRNLARRLCRRGRRWSQ